MNCGALWRIAVVAMVFGALGTARANAQQSAWEPPLPKTGDKDWIRFRTGEWLGGEITRLRREMLEFESEELESLELDWNNVAELRSPNQHAYVFVGRVVALGAVAMKDSVLVVVTTQGAQEFRREDLVSIVPGGTSELDYWTAFAHVGYIFRQGNTNQGDFNAVVSVRRGGPLARLQLDYNGNYGRVDGVETIDNHNGAASFDWFLNNRLYIRPFAFDIYADQFQNIDFRTSPSMGVGVRAIETVRFDLDVNLGVGYQWTQFASVEPGHEDRTEQGTIIPSLNFHSDITNDLEFKLDYELRVGIPDVSDSFHHLLGMFTVDLTGALTFDVSFTWDRNHNPQPNVEGIVPAKDDVRLNFGVGLDF